MAPLSTTRKNPDREPEALEEALEALVGRARGDERAEQRADGDGAAGQDAHDSPGALCLSGTNAVSQQASGIVMDRSATTARRHPNEPVWGYDLSTLGKDLSAHLVLRSGDWRSTLGAREDPLRMTPLIANKETHAHRC